ncbi:MULTISPECIES: DUF4404 family protein [unclassified Streptomyces]|uniref:DUF4404 family protein n=1 Tax=unclassified Streptomyces TaxID=2593676 RepID=UPI002E2EC91A|nr:MULTISPECIES: DUF4404 family protein [unclassified Streptomyces]WUC67988.1 DUF4404 family protein [Streptomyces sp. NBC_00539]
MSVQDLRDQLRSLRKQLEEQPALTLRERDDIHALIDRIEDRLRTGDAASHSGLTGGVTRAAERFEAGHPKVAGTLRSIGVALANIGI